MTEHRLIDYDDDAIDDIDYEDVPEHERWTYALDSDGDILWDDVTNTFRTAHGTNAAEQSLLVACGTVKTDDPIDDEFGIDIFRATKSNRHLEREIRRTLNHDDHRHDRVERIDNVDIVMVGPGRHARVFVTLTLDTGDQTELDFAMGVPV